MANKAGLIIGVSATCFAPDMNMTREHLAVLITRELGPGHSVSPDGFTDYTQIDDWAKTSMAEAIGRGMLRGYPDGTIKPHAFVTRAEAVVMIQRCLTDTGKI